MKHFEDGRLLFLTTSHPFTRYSPNTTALNGATFTWNEDLSTCGGSAATPVTSTGCTVLVTDGFFTLLELKAAPNLAELYYLGWDYNATGNYSSIFQSATSVKKGKVTASGSPTTVAASISNTTDALTESSGSGVFKFSSFSSGNTEKQGRGAPLLAGSVGKKARGVYIGGTEAACGNGPGYFAYLHSGLTSLLSYLRDGSETNTSTVHMNYCKPSETLSGPWQTDIDYYVTGSIVSTQNIANGFNVSYNAGTFVELNNGFVSGDNFIAEINPCVITKTIIASKTDDFIEEPKISENNLDSFQKIKIYPTVLASGNAINIEATQKIQKLQVTIYDIQVKAIQQTSFDDLYPNQPYSVLLSSVSAGLYFVRVQSNSISFTQKIIVR